MDRLSISLTPWQSSQPSFHKQTNFAKRALSPTAVRIANEDPFDIADCGGYCGIGAAFSHPNYLSFDPRVSVAYSPEVLGGKTVFRAGFGTYHGEVQLGDQDSPAVNTEPSTLLTSGVQSDGSVVQYSYPVPPSLTPSTGLALTPRSMARNRPDNVDQRPNRTPGVPLYLGSRGISHWINPAAFSLPAVGTWATPAAISLPVPHYGRMTPRSRRPFGLRSGTM
jgi:hypothetical protein